MDLAHNQVFVINNEHVSGFFRVIVNAQNEGCLVLVKIQEMPVEPESKSGEMNKNKNKLLSKLIWIDKKTFAEIYQDSLRLIEIEHDGVLLEANHPLNKLDSKTEKIWILRKKAMQGFLDSENLKKKILEDRSLGGLVKDSVKESGISRMEAYKLFSQLCVLGFSEISLLPRFDKCGGRGISRPCDGNRKKAGRKTEKERIALANGIILPPSQQGMSTQWKELILAADSRIALPKPPLPERCRMILTSNFVQRYHYSNGMLTAVDLEVGKYPNIAQIRRVLEQNYTDIERATHKTTVNNFILNHRGLTGKNWEGVGGPGHTWAIDSSIGDIYLRSTCNRSWIMGRPIVYVITDVWSTAVIGFYVCFSGPSWEQAKVAIFSAATNPTVIANIWGHESLTTLDPIPTLCHTLLSDRGEYLSVGARETAFILLERLSYTAPYRGDWKGGTEVLHRIEKDQQFYFIPGAIDARRKEYELRKFNPLESVMTLHEYVAYLNILFYRYNFCSDRSNRLDSHMKAAGLNPTPAGLWNWGHSIGIGYRKTRSNSELITTLLPSSKANITKYGIRWAGAEYRSEISQSQEWACHARNYGSKQINVNYFPGSLQKIWTPNETHKGLLELNKTDYSGSSAELSLEEIVDAHAFKLSQNESNEYQKTKIELITSKMMSELVKKAKGLTNESDNSFNGTRPSIKEVRAIETSLSIDSGLSKVDIPMINKAQGKFISESQQNHAEMMDSILQSIRNLGDTNENP